MDNKFNNKLNNKIKDNNKERLQKYMARCGVASRRKSEELIQDGHVKVNGMVITEMGYKISKGDEVEVDGELISPEEIKKYYLMNKPRSCLSTVSDPKGRKTVISILPDTLKQYRLFPVGRLDYDTKGVIILTNDGEFMNMLVGPKSNVEKEYLARVVGIVTKEELMILEKGVRIKDDNNKYYESRPCLCEIESVDRDNNSTLVRITIQKGKYHQVKRMLEYINHDVKRLTRVRFGVLSLGDIKEGEIRELTIHEVKQLIADSKTKKKYEHVKLRRC